MRCAVSEEVIEVIQERHLSVPVSSLSTRMAEGRAFDYESDNG